MGPLPNEEALVTRDYGGEGKALSMSKANLGQFVYHLLKLGGRITGSFAMNAKYDRSYVQFSIVLPKGRREKLTELTGIALEEPSYLKPA